MQAVRRAHAANDNRQAGRRAVTYPGRHRHMHGRSFRTSARPWRRMRDTLASSAAWTTMLTVLAIMVVAVLATTTCIWGLATMTAAGRSLVGGDRARGGPATT